MCSTVRCVRFGCNGNNPTVVWLTISPSIFFSCVCVAFPYFGFGLSLCVFILCVGWVFLFLLRAKAIANAIIQRFVFRSAFKAQKNAHKENWLEKAQIRPLFRHFQVANEQYSFLFVRFDGNSLNFTASTQKEFHLFTWFQYKWEEIMSYFRHWEYFATIFLIICHEMVRRAFFRKDNDKDISLERSIWNGLKARKNCNAVSFHFFLGECRIFRNIIIQTFPFLLTQSKMFDCDYANNAIER